MKNMSVAVIGAGICGLTISAKLSAFAIDAFVIEKSKGVGGRMATRRDGDATYDHGASFYVESELESNIWHKRWQNLQKSKYWLSQDQMNYYVGSKGMASLAKDLAENANTIFSEKVINLDQHQNGMRVFCESGRFFEADKVIMSCPLPQSLSILQASKVTYPETLNHISYSKALVGLIELEEPIANLKLNFINLNSAIYTIANNQKKGISKKIALTIVMSDRWSDEHFDLEDSKTLQLIETELKNFLKIEVRVCKSQLKKWRYCKPNSIFKEKFVSLLGDQILMAGDAFGGGSIAGALRSADSVIKYLSQNFSSSKESL